MIVTSLLLLPSLAFSLPTSSSRLMSSAFHQFHREPLVPRTNWSNSALDIEPRRQSLQLLALGKVVSQLPQFLFETILFLQVGQRVMHWFLSPTRTGRRTMSWRTRTSGRRRRAGWAPPPVGEADQQIGSWVESWLLLRVSHGPPLSSSPMDSTSAAPVLSILRSV